MDHLVDQTVLILTNEPADIYANPTFLPDTMAHDYDKYWTCLLYTSNSTNVPRKYCPKTKKDTTGWHNC